MKCAPSVAPLPSQGKLMSRVGRSVGTSAAPSATRSSFWGVVSAGETPRL